MRLKLRVMMVCVASACGLCGLSWVTAGAAWAGVDLSTTVQPARLRYPQERVLTYRLAMTTGDREERVSVRHGSPPFTSSGPVTLEGPGVVTGSSMSHEDPAPGFRICQRFPGEGGSLQFYEITLPPHSTSVLVHKQTLFTAPFPRADLSVGYSVASLSSDPITIRRLRSPRPTLTGQRGVRLPLTTRPQVTASNEGAFVRVRLGNSVLVRGRTDPAVGGDRIVLRAARYFGSRRPVTIARVRVAGDGRFSARWRPRRRGTYYLYAVYRSPRASLGDASTLCEIAVEVR